MSASFVLKDRSISGVFAGNDQSANYFTVSSGNRSYAVNTECVVPFAEVLIGDKYRHETYNKLALCKRGEELFFYINDELVYRNDYEGSSSYNTLGIIVPAKGGVSIKNFAVYTDENTTLRAAKPIGNPTPLREVSLPGMRYLK